MKTPKTIIWLSRVFGCWACLVLIYIFSFAKVVGDNCNRSLFLGNRPCPDSSGVRNDRKIRARVDTNPLPGEALFIIKSSWVVVLTCRSLLPFRRVTSNRAAETSSLIRRETKYSISIVLVNCIFILIFIFPNFYLMLRANLRTLEPQALFRDNAFDPFYAN